ncbi:MAG: glycosyltransferase [Desulfovibrionaceae bacterium]
MPISSLVLHDFFLEPDGGGRVALHLARLLGGDLVGGEFDPAAYPADHFGPLAPRSLGAYGLRMPPISRIGKLWRAFATMPRQERPVTVFSGQVSPLAHRRVMGAKVCYCHTPPRLLYDKREALVRRAPAICRPGLLALLPFYRRAYERAMRDMDLIICNSENVRRRVRDYLGLEAVVVWPPCGDGFRWGGQEDYYLSTARLDPLKRVDIIVRAFVRMPDRRLVVTGDGPEMASLRSLAGSASNIAFTGRVSDAEMRRMVGSCIATIYIPTDEDFGMSPVESMAAGKPVIGVAEGGVLETVEDGASGVLIPAPPSADALARAVRGMDARTAHGMREACEARAERFSGRRFDASMKSLLGPLTRAEIPAAPTR